MAAFMASSSSSSGAATSGGGGGGIRILDEAEVKARRSWVSPALDGDGEEEEDDFAEAAAAALARARGCDVYLGHGGGARRVVAWLRSELELLGVPCAASDRRRCRDAPSHAAARAAMDAAAAGVVVVTPASLGDPYAIEEIRVFADRGALVPILVGLGRGDLVAADVVTRRGEVWEEHGGRLWKLYDGEEREWREAVEGLAGAESAVVFGDGDVRDRVLDVLEVLGARLGRRAVTAAVKAWRNAEEPELPFPRNAEFVGREKELAEDLAAFAFAASEGPFITGVVCISGASGTGKTELALEFAHRHAREYKRVLWVRGEPRYFRQSYLKLADHLGVAVGDDVVSPPAPAAAAAAVGGGGERTVRSSRSLTDIEGDAIGKIRKELARDIPYLVVIDNVESAKDWWDGRAVQELLPRGKRCATTHVVITTRLAGAGGLQGVRTLELGRLAAPDAMKLMKGTRAFGPDDTAVLRTVEEDVGGVALGLALAGAVLSELDVGPAELRRAMSDAPHRAPTWVAREDPALRDNPGLARLLDASLALLDREAAGLGAAVARLLEASSFFAPAPIPVAVLARAAAACCSRPGASDDRPLWKRLVRSLHISCASSPTTLSSSSSSHAELEALVRLGFARPCAKAGHVAVHGVFRLFGRKTGSGQAGRPVVRAIAAHVTGNTTGGSFDEHVWAACLSLFKFEAPAATVELPSAFELARFVTRHALPLAARAVAAYSAYSAALELLREATDAVRKVEDMYAPSSPRRGGTGSRNTSSSVHLDPSAYEDVARARAELLMARARIMARAGETGIAEDHCVAAIDILEVVSGDAHPDTQAARAFLEQAVRPPPPPHSSSDLGS
ncbi:hypothetical protein EJB05_27444, partial [Eragrostis curvula]